MDKELREILDSLDKVLARQDTVSQQLWNVLTGLRGPDSDSWPEKQEKTVPIRRLAFPLTAKLNDSYPNGAYFGEGRLEYPFRPAAEYSHFNAHAVAAWKALNGEL